HHLNLLSVPTRRSSDLPIEIFGVRHGQSLGQVDPSAYPRLGDSNLPLTELGFAQGHNAGTLLAAYAIASKKQPLTIYTSTCLRRSEEHTSELQSRENLV